MCYEFILKAITKYFYLLSREKKIERLALNCCVSLFAYSRQLEVAGRHLESGIDRMRLPCQSRDGSRRLNPD
jgi:hypothetical protein